MHSVLSEELPLDAVLQQAVAQHNSGNLIEAERLYRGILARDPGHAHTQHNLGIVALQTRNATAALPHLEAAVARNPDHLQYWLSYTSGLMQAGLVGDARLTLARASQRGLHDGALEALAGRLHGLSDAIDRRVWMPDLTGEHYTRFLERLHRVLRPQTYLEIGVQTGATLALGGCASVGIDPKFQLHSIETMRRMLAKPSLLLYQMRSDDFFALHSPTALLGQPIDLAFLDGMHRCEFLLRDFVHTERHCRPNSVIALHDCLPLEMPMAERTSGATAIDPLRQGMWTGDVWRTALLLKRRRPDLRIIALDAAPTGLVLITNLDPRNNMLAEGEERLIAEMRSWTLDQITLAGLYRELEVEPEISLRHAEQLLQRLHPQRIAG
jgi:hypothetical protein